MAKPPRSNPPAPAAFAGGTGPASADPTGQQQPSTAHLPPPTLINVNVDPTSWKHLPEPVVTRLRTLRREHADASAVWRSIAAERAQVWDRKRAAEVRLTELTGPHSEFGKLIDPAHPSIVEATQRRDRAIAEVSRLDPLVSVRSHARAQIGQLVEQVEQYLREHLSRPMTVPLHLGPEPELRKDETALDCLQRIRFRLRELDADVHKNQIVALALRRSQAREGRDRAFGRAWRAEREFDDRDTRPRN